MFCTSPISIYKRGSAAVLNPATGLPERQTVACGRCHSCVASRKNDWSGRLMAEALTAKSIYFVTLTYAVAPEDFPYRDVQLMLKSVRKAAAAAKRPFKVRFFCVGERGNLFGRVHWHLLLFCDQVVNIRRPRKNMKWRFWPHGWTNIQRIDPDDAAKSVRYVAKYAVKSLQDDGKSCRPRASMKPMIGAEYLEGVAVRLAQAGLPAKGWYNLPGLVYTKGRKTGQPIRFRLTHASARRFARIYCGAWDEREGNFPFHPYKGRRPYLHTEWLARWSDVAVNRADLPKFDWTYDRWAWLRRLPGQTKEYTYEEKDRQPKGDGGPPAEREAARRRYLWRQGEQQCEYLLNRYGDCEEVRMACDNIRWDVAQQTYEPSHVPECYATLGDSGAVEKPVGFEGYADAVAREPKGGGVGGNPDDDPFETFLKIDVAANVKEVAEYLASFDAGKRQRAPRPRAAWTGQTW